MKKMLVSLLVVLFISGMPVFISEDKDLEQSWDAIDKEVSSEMNNKGSNTVADPDNNLFFHKPDNFPVHTYIKVFKKQRVLELYGDDKLIGRFRIALGRSPEGDKTSEGDSKTPEGRYYICTRNANSKFTLFLGLSYPNTEDADIGLKNGSISPEEYDLIKTAEERQQRPLWDTALGGEVGIHGGGNDSDWTQGCIAVSDEDIRILWAYTSFKTPVVIFE
ncbi:MAG TPA: L,D-transpeptidase family protein [Clostridia bacterium]|nr:L,D-transpeptidase family protein [Clostridia bacterium]